MDQLNTISVFDFRCQASACHSFLQIRGIPQSALRPAEQHDDSWNGSVLYSPEIKRNPNRDDNENQPPLFASAECGIHKKISYGRSRLQGVFDRGIPRQELVHPEQLDSLECALTESGDPEK